MEGQFLEMDRCNLTGKNINLFTHLVYQGAKSLFPIFPGVILAFSQQKFPFWYTPKKFQWFPKSEKQKKQTKKKKKVLSFFQSFFPFHFSFTSSTFPFFPHFPPSLFHFSSFSSKLSIFLLFFLASFFPISHQKFPTGKSLGGTLPPAPPLPRMLRHCSLPVIYFPTTQIINKLKTTVIFDQCSMYYHILKYKDF